MKLRHALRAGKSAPTPQEATPPDWRDLLRQYQAQPIDQALGQRLRRDFLRIVVADTAILED